jgi:glycerol uptake operon antiterminator
MGRLGEHRMEEFLRQLERNPVIPAVRTEGEPLEKALSGDHPALIVLGGDIFKLTRRIGPEKRRPLLFINLDLIGGVAGDATGIRFLSLHVEGIISTSRRVVELANSTDLITIQRLFALDAMAMERGLKLIKRTKPRCVEILPALAYPRIVSSYPELRGWPVLAGGFVRRPEELSFILDAGAAGVSTSHQGLWNNALDSKVKT